MDKGNSEKIATLNRVYLTKSYISKVPIIFRPCTSTLKLTSMAQHFSWK